MNNSFFNKRLILSSTILFLLGIFFGIQPDFKKLFILEYKEIYVIVFGYLPTWGIVFTLSIRNILSNDRIKFTIFTILLYCLLHYAALRLRPTEFTMILSSLGALLTLVILKLSEKEFAIRVKDYFIVTIIGGLTFLPWGFENKLLYASLSVYLWQLSIGHYCNYFKFKFEKAQLTRIETQ